MSENQATRTIAIVGAGFCGTALAIQLLRQPALEPRRILLIDAVPAGRGIAYARRDHPYLLNVPAGRMSADPDDPLSFLRYLNGGAPEISADDFVPRYRYGDYLQELLHRAEFEADPGVKLARVSATACDVVPLGHARGYQIELVHHPSLTAQTVVFACGNPPPAPLPPFERLRGHAGWIADPWQAPGAFRSGDQVLVVGTGLTMVDVVLAGVQRCADLVVHAISRHGLIALAQTEGTRTPVGWSDPQALPAAVHSILQLLRTVRGHAREVEDQGGDWREVITTVRNLAPALWQRLPTSERRRFLRHVRSRWDQHRHRLPPASSTELRRLQERGQLLIRGGCLVDFEPVGHRIRVRWRARGQQHAESFMVDRIVNCTGPDHDVRRAADPLVRSLLARELASPDPLGLGLRTGAYGQLIGPHGQRPAGLYYIGPLLRASYWESTAVQELREHAARLAAHLAVPEERLVRS